MAVVPLRSSEPVPISLNPRSTVRIWNCFGIGSSRARVSRIPTALRVLLLVVSMAGGLGWDGTAYAETVVVVGTAGSDGADGAVGSPGLPGEPGEDGASATAIAGQPGEDNFATATGGAGGRGGRGGDAAAMSGADGGAGGDGGDGGAAIAEATVIGSSQARATASGGRGGRRGEGGIGSSPGLDGAPGSRGGAGGRAIATARAERSSARVSDGEASALDVRARASGGRGGSDPFADGGNAGGGDAEARAVGQATGNGSSDEHHGVSAEAFGGRRRGSAAGGSALAEAEGSASHGSLAVTATAVGGLSGRHGSIIEGASGGGGNATAIARGELAGTGDLDVDASVIAFSDDADSASAEAEGISTGGGDVRVSSSVERRSFTNEQATELHDAVRGATAGTLTLSQSVSTFSGEARTSLVGENGGGGALILDVAAFSGTDPLTAHASDGGDVVVGDVIGRSTTGADVDVRVRARGATVRTERSGSGGTSERARVEGISNGGQVSVSADYRGENAFIVVEAGGTRTGADGASLVMEDVVSGTTAGSLALEQIARGGNGRSIFTLFPTDVDRLIGGSGGDVVNRLTHSASASSALLVAESRGGRGGRLAGNVPPSGRGGSGGVAQTVLDGSNDAGNLEVRGMSHGGDGGGFVSGAGDGGEAVIDLRGRTFGDGQRVVVLPGSGTRQFGTAAFGGQGGSLGSGFGGPSPTPGALAGDGGAARSHSEGIAEGDSEVEVVAGARAGGGGNGASPFFGGPSGVGGRGGDASSTAIATGAGSSLVSALSRASGGRGGFAVGAGGDGGDAEATATAAGLGVVESIAHASGGEGGRAGARVGSARARAEASGATVLAQAEAASGRRSNAFLAARVSRQQSGSTAVEATSGVLASSGWTGSDAMGSARITSQPEAGALDAAFAAHPGLPGSTTSARIGAFGEWRSEGADLGLSTQRVELDITLATPEVETDLLLAVFELESSGGGFLELAFDLELDGEAFGDRVVLESLADARVWFAELIDLGSAFADRPGVGGTPAVRAIFEITQEAGQSVRFGMGAVVPEPSTAVLLGLGLALAAARRPGVGTSNE